MYSLYISIYMFSLRTHIYYEKIHVMKIVFYERICDEYILVLSNTYISSVCVCERER